LTTRTPSRKRWRIAAGSSAGFCTPGIVVAAKALLDRNPDPTEEEIREAISGNLCRCTGYSLIIEGIKAAAARLAGGE
jgi:aerobic-type carbon monoxide dehydrogenase small subunit (CoxS/CutS family)